MRKNGFVPILIILVIAILGVVVFVGYKNYLLKPQLVFEKRALIRSTDVNDVAKAIILGFASDSQIQSAMDPGDSPSADSFHLPSYRVDLTQSEATQLNKYLNYDGPVSNSSAVTVDNQNWEAFVYSTGSNIYTKNGYMCKLSYPYSPPFVFQCIKVHQLKDNTLNDVGNFIKSFFSEAGINCNNQNCNIKEVTSSWPLEKYGRQINTRESIILDNNTSSTARVGKLASESSQFLKSAGWNVVVKDDTLDEKHSGFPDVLASVLVTAENNLFNCTHTIIILSPNVLRHWVNCMYKVEKLPDIQSQYDPYK